MRPYQEDPEPYLIIIYNRSTKYERIDAVNKEEAYNIRYLGKHALKIETSLLSRLIKESIRIQDVIEVENK